MLAVFDDEAALAAENECARASYGYAIGGPVSPSQPLSAFDGDSLAGTWTLRVADHVGEDTGSLWQWSLAAKTVKTLPPIAMPTAPATPTPTGTTTATPHAPSPTTPLDRLPGDADCSGTVNAIDAPHPAVHGRQGVRLKAISAQLGHSSIRGTADLYAYLTGDLEQEAADEFDRALTNG